MSYEYRQEELKRGPNYEKLKAIDDFKRLKYDFMQKNKGTY